MPNAFKAKLVNIKELTLVEWLEALEPHEVLAMYDAYLRDETVLVTPSETEPDMYCNVVIGHIMLVDLCVDHIKKIV